MRDLDRFRLEHVDSLARVDAAQWDRLAGESNPFLEHRFLYGLEVSGSVGSDAGWVPHHLLAWEGDALVGAVPLYVKDHSYGEYIFDWQWAEAALRAGIPYYPKLVCGIPFTPVAGSRFLIAEGPDRSGLLAQLKNHLVTLTEKEGIASVHVLFCTEREMSTLSADGRFLARRSHQFHWQNNGYETFEHFLSELRHAGRKNIRRDRKQVQQAGLRCHAVDGEQLTPSQWEALYHFYRDTHQRKWGQPYLTHAFFRWVQHQLADRVVATLAYDGTDLVAGALHFAKGGNLFGRYWGCLATYDALHFELCYYQPIELCIRRGWRHFEAGAQGIHKLKRGLMPAFTYSAYYFQDQHFQHALAAFVDREDDAICYEMKILAHHGPFKRHDDQREPRPS